MSIGNDPGSLSITSKVFGTLPSSRIGSFGSNRVYAGTMGRSVTGAPYGSFGTVAARVARFGQGSVRGTLSAHRSLFASYPGTWRVRASGTLHGYFAAPPQARWVAVHVSITPGARAYLRQSLSGTISHAGHTNLDVGVEKDTLAGWVLPGRGSYVIGTLVSSNVVVLYWKELDP